MNLQKYFIGIIALCSLWHIVHPDPFAYVSCASNTVVIVDTATNTIVGSIPIAGAVQIVAIAITSNNKYAYVSDAGSNNVYVLDLINKSVFTAIPTTGPSTDLAITIDSKYVFVSHAGTSLFDVIATATNALISGSPFSTTLLDTNFIAMSPDGKTAYITDDSSNNVAAINVANPTIQTTIANVGIGLQLNGIAVTPDSNTAYVANKMDQAVYRIINLQTSPTVVIGSPIIIGPSLLDIAITLNSEFAYVGSANSIYVIDTSTNSLVTGPQYPIPTGNGLGIFNFTGDNRTCYAPCFIDNIVTVIPTNTNIPLMPSIDFSAFPMPVDVAISPIGSPENVAATRASNVFLLQTDLINIITWSAPQLGTTPVVYNIYRDAALTQLIGTVPATSPLQFYDHDRQPNVTYTYYITAVGASGNSSQPSSVTIVG